MTDEQLLTLWEILLYISIGLGVLLLFACGVSAILGLV